MKSILISIQPKWCELIASGKKTVEVRKTAPKEVPFKAYIYATKPKARTHPARIYNSYIMPESGKCGSGKVIGEFICDKVEKFNVGSLRSDDIEELACLSYTELINYFYKPCELDGKTAKQGYAWHISELKIYDEPRELYNFHRVCNKKCSPSCDWYIEYDYTECGCGGKPNITRPPQSWCYVEEV